ncbi:hypothetical protein HF521_013443 [Silurus meridionalis]|uniref:Peripheral-type benzodiazepine receptor-associated protein 1 n=1 Tax=Silurus meridionalis TaxID=175797 RepID=A0A8T0AC60_SILME|nr:hypothetical protein HF521_013443 [Silurus meridionalis]
MGKNEAESNYHCVFSKKAILQSRRKTENKKVSPCHSELEAQSQPVLGPGCEKEKALQHQCFDHTNLKQAGELCQRLADEITGIVRPSRTTDAGENLAEIDSSCKGNGAAYCKLEELLNTLHGVTNKEKDGLLQCLWEEVELEKSYFLCHLLKVHGHPSLVVEESEDKVIKETAKWRSEDSQKRPLMKRNRQKLESSSEKQDSGISPLRSSLVEEPNNKRDLYQSFPDVGRELHSSCPPLEKLSPSRCSEDNMEDTNGEDCDYLVRQNSELLRALEELEKTVSTLREENSLLRKSSCPETDDKVKRLRRKNAELAVIAKRLEERAHKLQEANLKVVNAPIPIKPGIAEQYKRAFARQRARDLAQHADTLLSKDKEIAALQHECRQLEARIGQDKGGPGQAGAGGFERLLKESQKEVLRLQRQLSASSARDQSTAGGAEKDREQKETPVVCETPQSVVNEVLVKGEESLRKGEENRARVIPEQDTSSTHQEEQTQKDRIEFLESELSKKRKECEGLEHEVRKRQKRCLDLESQLEDERSKNERLTEETELLRRKAQLLEQSQVENEELREELSTVSARYSSVLEENQRLRAKLENLEQVLKHMREVAERRQQLELEHEQALAILKFKQDEIKRLQRAQLFAKREHEGVVQMLEALIQFVLLRELAKVRELEQKCRSQSEQFSLLSQELDKFRQQASKIDLSAPGLLCSSLTQLPNGLSLPTDTDLAAVLRSGSTPYSAGLSQSERSPGTKHRELPSLNPKSTSTSTSSTSPQKSENIHLSPKSATNPRKASPTHEVDTASEVEELDIDVSPIPFPASRAAKLQVFIARYSYNPYDGPNDNPEVELPLTAGEYIYVYGDMDDDGFYEGELMDGRRGLVPSNFVERISDDEAHEATDFSHNSFVESSFHSTSERPHQHQHHVRLSHSITDRTEASATNEISKPGTVQLVNGLDMDLDLEDDTEAHIVPHPHKLTLIKQLAKSIVLGWEAPTGRVTVRSYNVYVDQELRLSVPTGNPTKAVLERMDTSHKIQRVAVQSVTEHGSSDPLRCCMLVGKDVCAAPTKLRVDRIMATSARLTWLPSNSIYAHTVSLNGELRELVQAGRYSLRLGDLIPGLHYRVEVEAQLPLERREHKCAVTSFTTLTAGPPDAPLDVQLEQGPTPGIAQISWLPVTIDAAGTSNGVRVTGYTIYADKKKVLEVSSPTAGSALIGPSQIEMLQTAHELTVRTMSPHGESADSTPVNVPAKLPAIMAGASMPPCQLVPTHTSVLTTSATNKEPSVCATSLSAAKTPTMPLSSVLGASPVQDASPIRDVYANTPKAATNDAPLPTASYVEAWANPAVALQQSPSPPCASANLQETVSSPKVIPSPVAVPIPIPTSSALGSAQPSVTLITTPEPSREPRSPGPQRSLTSVTDFLDDPLPHKSSSMPSVPKVMAPETDLLDTPDTHPLRPPHPLPIESEPEGDRENTRLVSIEEFLQPEPVPRTKIYAGGLMDPPPDYHVESSRSDLSDILEEEEEDLYSESAADVTPKNYNSGSSGKKAAGLADAGTAWCGPRDISPKCNRSETKLPRDAQPVDASEVRIFVALFPYDPSTMSPNRDAAEEELPFKEGQIIKIYGDKDTDGFYHGESGGRHGYVPCNMVSEIQVDDDETRDQLLQQDFLSTETTVEKIVESTGVLEDSSNTESSNKDNARQSAAGMGNPVPCRMVAIFDYDPRESSPNADVEAELTFNAGDIIYVFGDMDDDGFFYGDLNGQKGLVPSNFLQAFPENGDEFAKPEHTIANSRRDSQVSHAASVEQTELHTSSPADETQAKPSSQPNAQQNLPPDQQLENHSGPSPFSGHSPSLHGPPQDHAVTDTSPPEKKKKGFFSKGKKLFKKLGSSKKE